MTRCSADRRVSRKIDPSRTGLRLGPYVKATRQGGAASELRGKISVDFQADADLNERRGAPGHFRLLAFCAAKLPVFQPKAKPLNSKIRLLTVGRNGPRATRL